MAWERLIWSARCHGSRARITLNTALSCFQCPGPVYSNAICVPAAPALHLHVMRLILAYVGPHGNLHILKGFEHPCAEVAQNPLRFPKSMVTGAKEEHPYVLAQFRSHSFLHNRILGLDKLHEAYYG
jgi:hypothetical protein